MIHSRNLCITFSPKANVNQLIVAFVTSLPANMHTFINTAHLYSLAAVNVSHNLLVRNMRALLMRTNNGHLIHMTEIV